MLLTHRSHCAFLAFATLDNRSRHGFERGLLAIFLAAGLITPRRLLLTSAGRRYIRSF